MFSSGATARAATSFFSVTKKLIEGKFELNLDTATQHLNIIGSVVNLVPVYWIAQEIVRLPLQTISRPLTVYTKVGLSIKTPANPRGDIDAKHLYSAFSEVAKYVRAEKGFRWQCGTDPLIP